MVNSPTNQNGIRSKTVLTTTAHLGKKRRENLSSRRIDRLQVRDPHPDQEQEARAPDEGHFAHLWDGRSRGEGEEGFLDQVSRELKADSCQFRWFDRLFSRSAAKGTALRSSSSKSFGFHASAACNNHQRTACFWRICQPLLSVKNTFNGSQRMFWDRFDTRVPICLVLVVLNIAFLANER